MEEVLLMGFEKIEVFEWGCRIVGCGKGRLVHSEGEVRVFLWVVVVLEEVKEGVKAS